jgi:hypothetical protein
VPFTVAHAVVAPPLSKLSGGRLDVTALAVGAMSPDFAYVVFLDTDRNFAHLAPGVVLFALPASLVVLAAWHGLVKRPLAALLPDRWAHLGAALRRPRPALSAGTAAATAGTVLAGAWTHVAWDSFTHSDGWAVQTFDVLREQVPVVGRRLYVWLQYGCGVAGMAVLLGMIAIWARRRPRVEVEVVGERVPLGRRAAGVAAIAAVTLLGGMANVARVAADGPKQVLTAGALGTMAGAAVAVTAYGLSQFGREDPEALPE